MFSTTNKSIHTNLQHFSHKLIHSYTLLKNKPNCALTISIFIQDPNTGHVVTRDHNVNTNLEKECTNINIL